MPVLHLGGLLPRDDPPGYVLAAVAGEEPATVARAPVCATLGGHGSSTSRRPRRPLFRPRTPQDVPQCVCHERRRQVRQRRLPALQQLQSRACGSAEVEAANLPDHDLVPCRKTTVTTHGGKEATMSEDELWAALDSERRRRIPHLTPEYPAFDMDNPDLGGIIHIWR